MRAIVDTNIIVSALLRQGSLPDRVVRAMEAQRLTPVVCSAIMAEYTNVLARPKFGFAPADVNELLVLIEQQAIWVDIPPYTGTPALPDPTDWPFIACALATGCPVVTGNTRHFPDTTGVRIMTAREWVEVSWGRLYLW